MPFITGAPTLGAAFEAGFAAFTVDVLKEMIEAVVKMAARAIFLSMGFPWFGLSISRFAL